MKKLIIILMLSTLFLSGCGIYNLNSFVLPDDVEFLALVEELDTPEKIGNYMEENFKYEARPYHCLTPYEFWKGKKGDCNDYSCFAVFMATQNNYEAYQLKIFYTDYSDSHALAVFKEKYYTFTDCQFYYREYLTIKDIVDFHTSLREKIWLKYIVYDSYMNIFEKVLNN